MLDLPDVIDAEAVGQFDLGQRILEQAMLGVAVPWAGQLVLIEESETHGSSLPSAFLPAQGAGRWRGLPRRKTPAPPRASRREEIESMRRPAAVDDQAGTGHEARIVRR